MFLYVIYLFSFDFTICPRVLPVSIFFLFFFSSFSS